jgi:carbon storage regulator
VLVVRRRESESVLIGEHIEVQVLEINGNQVKLGIRAPREVEVLRGEILATAQQNMLAAKPAAGDAVETLILQLRKTPSKTVS